MSVINRLLFTCVIAIVLNCMSYGVAAQEQPKTATFTVHLVVDGGPMVPTNFVALVLAPSGFYDLEFHKIGDDGLKEFIGSSVENDGKKQCVVRVTVRGYKLNKGSEGIQLETFVKAIEKLQSLRHPELPTHIYVVFGK